MTDDFIMEVRDTLHMSCGDDVLWLVGTHLNWDFPVLVHKEIASAAMEMLP